MTALWANNAGKMFTTLGLFHTLWESGQTTPALNEMERFLSLSRSREYAKLLRGLVSAPALVRRNTVEKRVATKKRGTNKTAQR